MAWSVSGKLVKVGPKYFIQWIDPQDEVHRYDVDMILKENLGKKILISGS